MSNSNIASYSAGTYPCSALASDTARREVVAKRFRPQSDRGRSKRIRSDPGSHCGRRWNASRSHAVIPAGGQSRAAQTAGSSHANKASCGIDHFVGRMDHLELGVGSRMISEFTVDSWARWPEIQSIVVSVQQSNTSSWRAP